MVSFKKLTIRDILFRSRMAYSNKPSLAFVGQEPVTYADMAVIVRNVSGMLNTLGIGKGDKVALIGENSPNWGMAYLAITSMGAVVVPILPDFSGHEMESIINHSEAKVVFVSAKLYGQLDRKNIPGVIAYILINNLQPFDESVTTPTAGMPYETPKAIVNVDYCDCELPRPDEDDLAAIIYTSGTTGRPKGVMLTHKNLVSNVLSTLMIQEVNENDRLLSILPLSHTYECAIGFLIPMATGASVYYLDKPPTPAVLIPAMQAVKPTMLLSVPLVIEKIYKNKIKPELTSSSLKRKLYSFTPTRKLLHRIAAKKLHKTFGGELHFFGIGGAKLSFEAERFLNEGRFPYSIGYGMTETSPLLTGSSPKLVRFRTAGFSIPGQELKLLNPNPHTGEGEIIVRGANVMVGYYKDPELTQTMFIDGWLRTGDLGYIDSDGYVEIRGRSKNMILTASGENIYPEEIEDVINKHEFVLESLVYELRGKLVARVHLNKEALEKYYENLKHSAKDWQHNAEDHTRKVLDDIMTYVNAKVSKFSRLNHIVEQQEPFVKTPTQKIKRFLYKE
ncbi:AMP-binding protein [Tenuifilum sp.]|uniref:AMP-binding protein n=3 Tax=Tenuifilum sp. TaxID=2760880 RepID=UPI001B4D8B1B|nr:AMP-binding protein [Bacteroidales bacterium]HOU73132.1 AMP-binding protein [Tenuifilum sp.]HQE53500.1 AMP-binding protein [Tenuifilum sp.]HQI87880.1 AMP-binding protein [Tenuifilum sp.]